MILSNSEGKLKKIKDDNDYIRGNCYKIKDENGRECIGEYWDRTATGTKIFYVKEENKIIKIEADYSGGIFISDGGSLKRYARMTAAWDELFHEKDSIEIKKPQPKIHIFSVPRGYVIKYDIRGKEVFSSKKDFLKELSANPEEFNPLVTKHYGRIGRMRTRKAFREAGLVKNGRLIEPCAEKLREYFENGAGGEI